MKKNVFKIVLSILLINPLLNSCNNKKDRDYTAKKICKLDNTICTDLVEINKDFYKLNYIYDRYETNGYQNKYKEKYNKDNIFSEYQYFDDLFTSLFDLINYDVSLLDTTYIENMCFYNNDFLTITIKYTFTSLDSKYNDFSFGIHGNTYISLKYEKKDDNNVYLKVGDKACLNLVSAIDDNYRDKINNVLNLTKDFLKDEKVQYEYQICTNPDHDC